MTIGKRLKRLRENADLTLEYVGSRVGVKKQTIYKYETGEVTNIPTYAIEIMAGLYETTPAYIMGWDSTPTQKEKAPARSRGVIVVPVLGSIPAGIPMEAIEDVVDEEELSTDDFDPSFEYFGLKVKGDSMYPKYLDGDTVIVRVQPNCETGEDCAVYINGHDATLKTVKWQQDGSMILHPINPQYPPRTYTKDEVAELPVGIYGVVKRLIRDF